MLRALASWLTLTFSIPAAATTLTLRRHCGTSEGYNPGYCVQDTRAVLSLMKRRPADFDLDALRVLAMTNVSVAGRRWSMHFAVYDGHGRVYDPSYHVALAVRPIALDEYVAHVVQPGRTHFRAVTPADFNRLASRQHKLDVFMVLGIGMMGMEGQSETVAEVDQRKLPPIQDATSIAGWLRVGQFEPHAPPDLVMNVKTLFPRLRPAPIRYFGAQPEYLMDAVRRAKVAVPEAALAAVWAGMNAKQAAAYFDLLDHHFIAPARKSKFDFAKTMALSPTILRLWARHPLRHKFPVSCSAYLTEG